MKMVDSQIYAESKFFEFYARYIWPIHRKFVNRYLSKRCNCCILSERYTNSINANNMCDICNEHNSPNSKEAKDIKKEELMKRELDKILNNHKGKGKSYYDALVLFSGGKDSSLLIYKLKNEFKGLRLLALTVDNSFLSPIALGNARNLTEKLDIDHIIFKPDIIFCKKMFRYAFTHLKKGGCYATVDRMDGDLTHDIGKNLAYQLEIPLLISGISRYQAQIILDMDWFEMPQK